MSDYPIWIGDAIWQAHMRGGYFLAEDEPVNVRGPYTPRRKDTLQTTLEYVQDHPGASTLDIAAALHQKSRSTLVYLERLVEKQVLRKERLGKQNRWWPA